MADTQEFTQKQIDLYFLAHPEMKMIVEVFKRALREESNRNWEIYEKLINRQAGAGVDEIKRMK